MDADVARALWKALVIHDAEAGESYLMGEDWQRVPLPHFSTDIDAAHRVVSVMQAAGWTLSVKQTVEPDRSAYLAAFVKPDNRHYNFVRHDSLPMALCLAALAAFAGLNLTSG
jgi:hypothetical protein